ncbi:dihydrolipoyl dehydrogenase family protein [Paucilactobacillus wasatchensis]|uniref:Glutathione reductase-like protein n=1 Tax=Paucilactobacillus wasatchensis TaxID=1335616 RepID=A0A0D1A5E3_9LACO|nr:NAD(P)/FAD-dependent oxidoreductase [Paucilactobacillus wasatchensis]KIS02922.1 glutathione reductase-like protein [Paucilactobacillus wasatchensis]
MADFDVIVIGAGPGGIAAAYGLRAKGAKVAIVEENLWGGTCPNRGCDPKKILYSSVEAIENARFLDNYGLTGNLSVDWPALMAHKREYTSKIPSGTKQGLDGSEITTLYGHAEFESNGKLQVAGTDYEATDYIIATGQRPAILPIEGKEYFQTSTDFLDLDALPKSVTFVGAGYVAFELATIANAAGSDVHIIHHNDWPLKEFDQSLVQDLVAQMKNQGIKFDFNIDLQSITKQDNQYILKDDRDFELKTDAVVSTAGRIPNIDTLGLDKVGVGTLKRGIQVNHRLRTDNSHIYALGDVVSRVGNEPKLTPVASFEGRYLANLLTSDSSRPIDYPTIPSVVYAAPKIARIGISPTIGKGDSDDYVVKDLDLTNWFTYFRLGEHVAKTRIVLDKQTHTIVGAQVLSSKADELINYLTTLINKHETLEQLQAEIFAYPTVASDLPYLF